MKKTSSSRSAFFILRITAALFLSLSGVFLMLLGFGAFSKVFAQAFAPSKISLPDSGERPAADQKLSPADRNGRFVYLVKFAEPGMLERRQDKTEERFNPGTREAQGHRAELMAEQAAHRREMVRVLGRDLEITHYFLVTHSGFAARLTREEAQILRRLPGVVSVERERLYNLTTFRGPSFIGADTIWNGTSVPSGTGTRGQGIVIGMLDTGVDSIHPSFANDATCGHGQGGAPNKLISSLDCSATNLQGLCEGPNPEDTNGHGSHTASTSGGNTLDSTANPPPVPLPPFTQISGVAPCANIRAYKVCPTNNCPDADIQAGMNSILLHGDVSVMNFSISGGDTPWTDNDRRKLDLVAAGVVVAASAGNTSAAVPDPVGQVNHLGPWVMTVAASTRDGEFSGRVSAAGPGSPPPDTQNIVLTRGSASPIGVPLTNFPIRHFPGQANEGCSAGPPGNEPLQFPPAISTAPLR